MIKGTFPAVTRELQNKFEKYVTQSVEHLNELKQISQFQTKWWHNIPVVHYFTKPTLSKNAEKLDKKLTKTDQALALAHFENVLRELTSKQFLTNSIIMRDSNQAKSEDYKPLIDIANEINKLKNLCLIEEKIYLLNVLGTLDIEQITEALNNVKKGIDIRIQAEQLIEVYTAQMVNSANKNTDSKFSPEALSNAFKQLATQNPSLYEKYKQILNKVEQINKTNEELRTLSSEVQEVYRLREQAKFLEAQLKEASLNGLLNIAQQDRVLQDTKVLAAQDPISFKNLYGTMLCLGELRTFSQDLLDSDKENIFTVVRTMNPDFIQTVFTDIKRAIEERKNAQDTIKACFSALLH